MDNNNFTLNGDQARVLMMLIINSETPAPPKMMFDLYTRLAAISNVQPKEDKK